MLRDPANAPLAITLRPVFEQLAAKPKELRHALESMTPNEEEASARGDNPTPTEIREIANVMESPDRAKLASALRCTHRPELLCSRECDRRGSQ